MARRGRKFLKITGWILVGIITLVLLITTAFYAGRNWLMEKALSAANEKRPGELQLGAMNMIPFMQFPSIAVQLKDVNYFREAPACDSADASILNLEELYVSFDIIDLLRGDLVVNQLRLVNGDLNYELFQDSLSNLEYALGQRLSENSDSGREGKKKIVGIDLEKIELQNVMLSYRDWRSGDSLLFRVEDLESRFRYRGVSIEAGLRSEFDLLHVQYASIGLNERKKVKVRADMDFDRDEKFLEIMPATLEIAGLELSAQGSWHFRNEQGVDIQFAAKNTGLEVLNFILLGVLDLDEIEQVQGGHVSLEGSVRGGTGGALPDINIRGRASDMAFNVRALNRDVKDIAFELVAGSGTNPDFSDAHLELKGFQARTSEGSIRGELSAANFQKPSIHLKAEADLDLYGLEELIRNERIHDMEGRLRLQANFSGKIDPSSDVLFGEDGNIDLDMSELGFIIGSDTLREVNGNLYVSGRHSGSEGLELSYNGDRMHLELEFENLLHYLLGYKRDVQASLGLKSDVLHPERILRDTSLARIIGEDVHGLTFRAGARISKSELDAFLKQDSLPRLELSLENFAVNLSNYANISDMRAGVHIGPDSIELHQLAGRIGSSSFSLSALMKDYACLLEQDTGSKAELSFSLASDLMKAEDFFYYRDRFLLPETYQEEHLQDLNLKGRVELAAGGQFLDSSETAFSLYLENAAWKFKSYPLGFSGFRGRLEKSEKALRLEGLSGAIGNSDFAISALIVNFNDSLRQNLEGAIYLESGRLDFNELMNYEHSGERNSAPALHLIAYPDIDFRLDVGELHYGENTLYALKGNMRSTRNKIMYLDSLSCAGASGGNIILNGQFSVANPDLYSISADVDLKKVNVDDLNFELKTENGSFTLKETFSGLLSAEGMAEIFINPELKLNMDATTAMFNVHVSDGRLLNFTPLEAVAKYLDNKDLSNVRFASLDNTFTLIDSQIEIPIMRIESSVGNMILEGEQGLDGSYLYLLRLPTWLVKEAVISRLTGERDKKEEDEIKAMKMGKFMVLTPWSNGSESKVRLGDRRDRYR